LDFLIDVIDPLGRRIVMDRYQLTGHIIPRHPEMTDAIQDIASALTEPQTIWDLGNSQNRYVGYNGWWVEVIVELARPYYGVVISAWKPRKEPMRGGMQLWP